DVAVMDKAVDQRAGHDVVAEDLAPLLEAFVRREHGGGVLVAAANELEEQHRTNATDGQIADLVDDHEAGKDESPEPMAQPAGLLGVLERGDQVGKRGVVDAAPVPRRIPKCAISPGDS